MRKFNTEGPVVAADHYFLPPLRRVNLGEVPELVRDKRYFVLHAPRQTGKTSLLLGPCVTCSTAASRAPIVACTSTSRVRRRHVKTWREPSARS